MNELISANTLPQTTMDDTVPKALGRLDMMLLLALGGMACLTTIICVGIVSFSGSQMFLSKDGFSMTQPPVLA